MSTLTVYPGSIGTDNPVDGVVARAGQNVAFTTLRAGVGTNAYLTDTSWTIPFLGASATTDQFAALYRNIFCFDTSALTAGATISAAVLSTATYGGKNAGLGSPAIHITGATPAATNTLAASDFEQVQFTSFANVAYASWPGTDNTYVDFTLDANGIANISKTNISKFAQILSWDQANSFTGTWSGSANSYVSVYYSNNTGTSNDPKLVITYTAGTSYTQNCTESVTISDVLVRATTRILSETATISDILVREIARALSESVTISDVLVRGVTRVLSESISIIDSILRGITRLLTESVTLTDTLSKAIYRSLSETITLTANVYKGITRILTETISLWDILWQKLGKAASSWTKQSGTASSWTKQSGTSSTWNRELPGKRS